MLKKSCDELPTSLVYMHTSTIPHKLIGHVLVEKVENIRNAVEFDIGKFNEYILLKAITVLKNKIQKAKLII